MAAICRCVLIHVNSSKPISRRNGEKWEVRSKVAVAHGHEQHRAARRRSRVRFLQCGRRASCTLSPRLLTLRIHGPGLRTDMPRPECGWRLGCIGRRLAMNGARMHQGQCCGRYLRHGLEVRHDARKMRCVTTKTDRLLSMTPAPHDRWHWRDFGSARPPCAANWADMRVPDDVLRASGAACRRWPAAPRPERCDARAPTAAGLKNAFPGDGLRHFSPMFAFRP